MSDDVLGIGMSVRCNDADFKDLAPQLDRIERLGVEFVEVPTFAMNLLCAGRVIESNLREARAMITDRPFMVTVHGPIGINLMSPEPFHNRHRDVLMASIEVAAALEARHYVLHSGTVAEKPEADLRNDYLRQREALFEAGNLAAQYGMTLAVENVYTYSRNERTALPSELAAEIAAVDHPNVKACFDVSHGFINGNFRGADFLNEAMALAPFAKHLHVHDSFGRPVDVLTYSRAERLAFGIGDLHMPIGWGSIPWDLLMERLRFHPGVIFNIELDRAYWSEAEACVQAVRELAAKARTTSSSQPEMTTAG